jgi:subfamily B ATP-binding cassette protein HlyB/CyaB
MTSPFAPQPGAGALAPVARASEADPQPGSRGPQMASADGAAPPTQPWKALCLLARLHHIAADPDTLAHPRGLSTNQPASDAELLGAAKDLGLKAKISRTPASRLSLAPLPALARLRNTDGSTRWVLLAQCDGQRVLFQDPNEAGGGRPTIEPMEVFLQHWAPESQGGHGELLLATSRASLAGALAKFDFSWFIPSIVRYRKLLGEVLVVSLFLQLFALVSPLFFQVVMDKVLVHRGLTTLDVLVAGLVIVVTFESLLTALRAYVFSHTTSRMDVELGARLFRHLLQLPLAYFQARRVGDSVARVRELENIRNFLTGQALTLVLDVVFSILFIGVMLMYSVPLTLIVLVSLPLYALIILSIVPVLRGRLNEKFARGAENQAMLVETITGIQTVKANALEPQMARRWDNQLAAYVSASFKTQSLATWANEGINLVGKLVNAATLWYGATLVMDHQLSVGQFVAFNMFAGRVAQPIMRMAQMWTEVQQTGIAMQRLGDILNTRTEVPPTNAAQLPPLKGRITLDKVTFRYRPEAAPVLHDVGFDIRAGEVIGIIGRSGSGKSTLTKLVQRLYVPEQGRVLIDGIDISLVDAAQLRRQIGVVLQDNFLFNRSVRENIAVADPAAPIEAVMHAARLAGAHDFISELPEGYDTVVGEQGASLSGGQRQRVAIARALFTNPRVLIFDEATSALDYESEAIIQRNMAAIARGRTVIIIAHRLSAVRHAHRIVAMDRGRIVEAGPHDELVQRPKGLYAYLWRMQQGTQPTEGAAAATNAPASGAEPADPPAHRDTPSAKPEGQA